MTVHRSSYDELEDALRGTLTACDTASEIRARIFEKTSLTASARISHNKFLVKLACDHRKPDGQFVVTPAMGAAFVETYLSANVMVSSGDYGEDEPAQYLFKCGLRKLTDPAGIETGLLAIADQVWLLCEKAKEFGRTVALKIKYVVFR
jgi:DNA polymerase IV